MLLIVAPTAAGVTVGVGGDVGTVTPGDGAFELAGAMLVIVVFDGIEAPAHPASEMADKAKTLRVATRGGTTRISPC